MIGERLVRVVPMEERELTALELVSLLEQITSQGELYRMFVENGKIKLLKCDLSTMATIYPVGDPIIKWAHNGRVARLEKP